MNDHTPTENAAPTKPGPGRPHTTTRTAVLVIFSICVVALFVAAVVDALVIHAGGFYWPLTLVGAVVIGALLSSGAVPYIRSHR